MDEIKKIEISDRLYVLGGIFFAMMVIFLLMRIISDFSSLPNNFPREITVTAEGHIFVEPDVAVIKVGVMTEGLETDGVVRENTEKMNKVMNEIKNLGIEEKDIKTAKYDLYPRYDYKDGERISKGYTLNNEIIIKIRNFEKIGSVIKLSTEKGVNLVGEIKFTVDDEEAVKKEAIKEAIGKAKGKAELIAAEAGFSLIKVINFFEETEPVYGIGGTKPMIEDASDAPIIQHGEQDITARVGLTYRIK